MERVCRQARRLEDPNAFSRKGALSAPGWTLARGPGSSIYRSKRGRGKSSLKAVKARIRRKKVYGSPTWTTSTFLQPPPDRSLHCVSCVRDAVRSFFKRYLREKAVRHLLVLSLLAALMACLWGDPQTAWAKASDQELLARATRAYNLGKYRDVHKIVQPLAEEGNVQAQILMGRLYENGLGVDQDPAAAVDWYGRAAEAGNAEGMVLLAYCYQLGFGVMKDGAQAFLWTQKAADLGSPEAQFNLAMMFGRGTLVDKNPKLAFAWAEKSAQVGYAEAQRYVGACYEHGAGVKKDLEKARYWYDKAAAQGFREEGSVFSRTEQ